MSIFSSISGWFKHVFAGQTPQTLAAEAHAAQIALNLLTPGLILTLQQAGVSESSPEITAVTTEVSNDLTTVSNLLTQAQTGADVSGQIITTLNAIKTNLNGLLAAGHIKNPKTVATVTNVVNAFVVEAQLMISEFSAPKTS